MVGFIQTERIMRQPKARQPKCPKCGSTNIKVTSSTQFRKKVSSRKAFADAICQNKKCQHTWWSSSKVLLAQARQMDKKRKKSAK